MVPVAILVLGALAAAGASWWSISRTDFDGFDVTQDDRWVVRATRAHPRLAAFLHRRLSTEGAGGALLTLAFAVLFLLALVAGIVFEMVDHGSGFARWDESVARWGAENATETGTRILSWITDLGGSLWVSIVGLVVAAWGYWRFRSWKVPAFMVFVVGGQFLVNNALKLLVGRERPDFAQLAGYGGTAFPSGHTAAAAATWAAVAFVLGRGRGRRVQALLGAMAVAVAGAVAATRVLLGVHWLTDVIAGIAVGWGWFVVGAAIFGGHLLGLGKREREQAQQVAGSDEQPVWEAA